MRCADWVVSLVLVALAAGITGSVIKGFQREFSLSDTRIQHTFAVHERITFGQDIVIAGVFPLLVIVAVGFTFIGPWDVHHGILGLVLSCSMTTVVTEIIKVMVGRPRPDFLSRCQPTSDATNAPGYGLSTVVSACSVTTGNIIADGFKSFPSGHTSFAFAGLGFLSLYLAGKMHLFDRRGRAIHAWVSLAPLLAALLVGLSRTMDYRHHATDVLAGGILGFVLANLAYFLYFPSLSRVDSHLPHLPVDPTAALTSGSRNFANPDEHTATAAATGYPLVEGAGRTGGVAGNAYERV